MPIDPAFYPAVKPCYAEKLTNEQRAWIANKSRAGIPFGSNSGRKAPVVDYKPDIMGMGVYFIVDLGRQDAEGQQVYIEVYREFPTHLLAPHKRGVRPRGNYGSTQQRSRVASSRWHGGR